MTISVCLATYNGERYLREQLTSILEQLGTEDEVVLSDDCSTDGTLDVARSFEDNRIRILTGPSNVGYSKNFERALDAARGDLIFIADQDDVWLPDKVARCVEALADADLVVTDVAVVDGELAEVVPSHFALYGVRQGFWPNFVATRYIGAAMAMRRSVRDAALPLPPRTDLCAYDYWLAVLAERYFRVRLIREPLMLYRRHNATASTGGDGSPFSIPHRIAARAYAGYHLARRARHARELVNRPV